MTVEKRGGGRLRDLENHDENLGVEKWKNLNLNSKEVKGKCKLLWRVLLEK
jgi:hypothetical protein